MILSDAGILSSLKNGEIVIDPLDEDSQVQPASVDLRLGYLVAVPRRGRSHQRLRFVSPWSDHSDLFEWHNLSNFIPPSVFLVDPGEFILAEVYENVEIGARLAARLEGKSSLARLGLLVHSTAGYVDPGWKGKLTLELTNVSPYPLALRPLMKICQISFHRLSSKAKRLYGSEGLNSKYKGGGLELSGYYKNEDLTGGDNA